MYFLFINYIWGFAQPKRSSTPTLESMGHGCGRVLSFCLYSTPRTSLTKTQKVVFITHLSRSYIIHKTHNNSRGEHRCATNIFQYVRTLLLVLYACLVLCLSVRAENCKNKSISNNALGKIEIHIYKSKLEHTKHMLNEWGLQPPPPALYVRNGNNISKYYADEKLFLYAAWSLRQDMHMRMTAAVTVNFEVMYDHKGLIAHYCG